MSAAYHKATIVAVLTIALALSFGIAHGAVSEIETKDAAACEALGIRVGKRLEKFEAVFETHTEAYATHRERLFDIAAKLDSENISSSRLRADITTLDEKVAAFTEAGEKVRSALDRAKELSCSTEFREAINEAKESQQKVGTIAQEIGDFIRVTITQGIREL